MNAMTSPADDRDVRSHRARRPLGMVAVAAASAMVMAACSSGTKSGSATSTSSAPPANSSPIKIGVLMSLSGPYATLFGPYQKTVTAWAAQNPTILGRPVQVIIQDDQGTTAGGEAATRLLIDQDHVDMMVGPGISNVDVAALPLIKAAGIVDVQPTAFPAAGDPSQNPYVFPDNYSSDQQTALFSAAVTAVHAQKIGLLGEDSALGHGTVSAIQADKTFNVVGTQFFPTGSTNLTTEEQKLQADGADAVILAAVVPQDIIAAVQGLGLIGWKAPLIGTSVAAFPQLVQAYGPLAKQVIVTGFTRATLNPLSSAQQQVRTQLQTILGGTTLPIPLFTALLYWVPLELLKYGIEGARSTDAATFSHYIEKQGGYNSLVGFLHYTASSHVGMTPAEAAIPDLSTLSDGTFDVLSGS